MRTEADRARVYAVPAATILVAVLAALVAAATAAAGPQPSARPAPTALAPVAEPIEPGGPWSRARLRAAEPLDAAAAAPAAGSPAPTATTAPGPAPAIAASRFSSKKLRNPATYPNRVHGRIFFSQGGSDFACSGTVVTSGAGTLITTAGHCVFDPTTGRFSDDLVFIPGYDDGTAPFGVWRATHAVTPGQWAQLGNLDFDMAMVQIERSPAGASLQSVVGSRGIGFDQPVGRKLAAYGYPAAPANRYDGESLVRCKGRGGFDPFPHSPQRSVAIGCDMAFGSSGGGFVVGDSYVVSNISHGHRQPRQTIFGPHYGRVARDLYAYSQRASYPSVGPVSCRGRLATIAGSDRGERITGTDGKDVIATLGGNDVVIAKGGDDVVCTGTGDDRVEAGGGRDRIDGGEGRDRCGGGADRDRGWDCERSPRIP